MRNSVRPRLCRFALLGLLLCGSAGAFAQSYPTRPIRLIVPYGPGGGADICLRLVSERLATSLGQSVLIENRPSAGGIIAAQTAIAADPDGYTLVATGAAHALSPAILKSVPYDIAKDLTPVAGVGDFELGFFVARESSVKTMNDLIASAKTHPRGLTFGIGSFGTVQHVTAEMFKSAANIDITIVPFKTVAQHFTALRSGEIDAVVEILTPMLGYVKEGSVRAIAVPSKARFTGLPDVPTVAEAGLPNFAMTAWNIVQAPARTPRDVINKLNKEINAVLRQPEIKKRFEDLGITPLILTPHETETLQADEMVRFRKVAKAANIELR